MTIYGTNMTDNSGHMLKVERPYYEQEQLNDELNYCQSIDATESSTICNNLLSIRPKKMFFSIFPLFFWLPKYSIKNNFIGDLVSGCTVAIMHIPQGLGYAMLANVPAITGIYTAFFPVLAYFLFGTSRHNSMGTFAVVSMLVGKTVVRLTHSPFENNHNNSTNLLMENVTNIPIIDLTENSNASVMIAIAITFAVGIIQIAMYIFRLGMLSSLLSETLVSGFTTGAGIHVIASQVKDLFGIHLTPVTSYFKVIKNSIELCSKIGDANEAAVVISAITITILIVNDLLKPKFSKLCFLPVPIELLAIVIGTLISRLFYLETEYDIKTIGEIPTGFPSPTLPEFNIIDDVIIDSIVIAIVSYTVSVSMALIFAQKLNYEIDFNQELLAMGTGNIVGTFFSCIPFSASLSRSIIQQSTGGKTQIASLISCGLLTFVLLWIGPFFEQLPRCVLASVIVVALKGMLMQVKHFFQFYKLSRLDATVWLVTFLTVVIVSIDIGLLVGIVFSLACIFIRGMKPYTCLLGHIPKTDLYLDVKKYKTAEEISSIKIFHYSGSINFASRNTFKAELCSLLKMDLAKEIRNFGTNNTQHQEKNQLKCLVIDFSALSYIDPSGVASLKCLIKDFNRLSIKVFIATASCPVYELMKKCDMNESQESVFIFFPTIHDAVHHAMENLAPIRIISE